MGVRVRLPLLAIALVITLPAVSATPADQVVQLEALGQAVIADVSQCLLYPASQSAQCVAEVVKELVDKICTVDVTAQQSSCLACYAFTSIGNADAMLMELSLLPATAFVPKVNADGSASVVAPGYGYDTRSQEKGFGFHFLLFSSEGQASCR